MTRIKAADASPNLCCGPRFARTASRIAPDRSTD
jgi:hypothetical protein